MSPVVAPSQSRGSLHACDLLAGRGRLVRRGDSDRWLAPKHGAEVFTAGLRRLENAARNIGGIEIINVCLRKPGVRGNGCP